MNSSEASGESTVLIEADEVTRRFGTRVALHPLDLSLAPGEIVAIVGPNGSGKSTFLKMIAGFLRPTAGGLRVLGRDPFRERARVMERARFAFAPPPLYDSLTAREQLRHLSAIGGRSMRVSKRELEEALDRVGLLGRADDRVRTFSFGMRQRLALAQALLPRPTLLVLDEPTDGLDPLAILELREILRRLGREEGIAILLATHLITEVDALVDRMLILDEGKTLFLGPPAGLIGESTLRIESSDDERASGLLGGRLDDDGVVLPADALTLAEARARLTAEDIELLAFSVVRPSLEAALLARLRMERS